MPAYYFAMEGYPAGGKPDPATDTLISIQYQKIDLTTGEPLGPLTILKAWESSEQAIITTFYNQFFKPEMPVTHFIPVGMQLDYEYEMLLAKCKQYHLPAITSHQLYYQRPRFDLKPVIVLLNDGRLAGARLDAFTPKKYDESHMKKWYDKKDFKKIEHFIGEETAAFLKLLQYLNKYKTRLGITKKEDAASRTFEEIAPSPAKERATVPARPKTPVPAMQPAKKRVDARTPAPQKSSAGFAKATPSSSSQRSTAGPKSSGQRTSVPLSQFRKHSPAKKNPGRRDR